MVARPSPTLAATVPVVTPLPASALPAAPARPQPTTRTAGLRLLPYYAEVRQLFPLLPVDVQIDLDEPAGTDPNALFRGLNPLGQPIFTVREDFVLDRGTAAHEIGHAFDAILTQKIRTGALPHARYWTFRGFPGTWEQAAVQSQAQTSSSAYWIWSPTESWAEAFRAAVTLERKERTLDYGMTIDPAACRSFFLEMMALASAAR